MNGYTVFWLVLAAVFCMIEAATANLTTIWFAVSAVIVAVLAAFDAAALTQLLGFMCIAIILLVLTRPLVKKLLVKKTVATNADRIISQLGVVTEEVDPVLNKGQVMVMGQSWSAKSEDNNKIEVDRTVVVVRLEGVRAVVKPVDDAENV